MEPSEKQKPDEIIFPSKNWAIEKKHDPLYGIFMWLPVLLTVLVYLSVLKNGFVNWDDDFFILKNIHIHSLDWNSLKWIFLNYYQGNWIPLTLLSFAVDYRIGGLEPLVYHLNNLILHALNTALVFSISFKTLGLVSKLKNQYNEYSNKTTTMQVSFVVALLFGIHPIHVQSVAWVAERKDLLSGCFFLLSLLVYLDYVVQQKPKKLNYFICLGLFVFSLLSKPIGVSLPFVFLLLDYWPLKRFSLKTKKIILEKLPFFITAFLISIVATTSQIQAGATPTLVQVPLTFRIMNSCHSLIFYMEKFLFPLNLAAFYPMFLFKTFSTGYLISASLVVLIFLVCFVYRNKHPYLIISWLYYFLTLAPVIGIIQIGSQAAADRYTYLPCLGPFLLLASTLIKIFPRFKTVLVVFATSWFLFLGYETVQQIGKWKDSISLWENVLAVNPKNNPIVYTNMAFSYQENDRLDDALRFYKQAIDTGVPQANPHCGMGEVELKKGLFENAIKEFKTAIALDPNYAQPHSDLAMVYEKENLLAQALLEAKESIRLEPEFAPGYEHLGLIYEKESNKEEAVNAFKKAQSLEPDNPTYTNDLNRTLKMVESKKR